MFDGNCSNRALRAPCPHLLEDSVPGGWLHDEYYISFELDDDLLWCVQIASGQYEVDSKHIT
eukprot:6212800-Pleurochrysis_carterae.AAC.4